MISENAVGSVLGTQVKLMPTSGTTCQYVATGTHSSQTVFVLAPRESRAPETLTHDEAQRVNGVVEAAVRIGDTLYVRRPLGGTASPSFRGLPTERRSVKSSVSHGS